MLAYGEKPDSVNLFQLRVSGTIFLTKLLGMFFVEDTLGLQVNV